MQHLLLQAQAWWDAQRFDQPMWQVAEWRDQKVRHIQLHVAKALGKVVAAYGPNGAGPLGASERAASGKDPIARVRDEVLPDVAIYRSQLINTCADWDASTASLDHRSDHVGVPAAEPLWHVVMLLSRASAQLAAYIEPREHGEASPTSHIRGAIQDLHASAEALAAYFSVDLAQAHRARLEALLATPLPTSVAEGDEAGR